MRIWFQGHGETVKLWYLPVVTFEHSSARDKMSKGRIYCRECAQYPFPRAGLLWIVFPRPTLFLNSPQLHWFFFYFCLGQKKIISHENERENKHQMYSNWGHSARHFRSIILILGDSLVCCHIWILNPYLESYELYEKANYAGLKYFSIFSFLYKKYNLFAFNLKI